jgi:hypothetical protein
MSTMSSLKKSGVRVPCPSPQRATGFTIGPASSKTGEGIVASVVMSVMVMVVSVSFVLLVMVVMVVGY